MINIDVHNLYLIFIRKYICIYVVLQGEYRVTFDKVYPCESTKDNSIKFNLYINKKTSSIKEFKGNITYLIPFDDTLTVSKFLMIHFRFV